jgi:hypothetical protein
VIAFEVIFSYQKNKNKNKTLSINTSQIKNILLAFKSFFLSDLRG